MSERRFPWRTLFVVSAGLNLILVGAVVGAIGAGVRLQRENPGAVVERMPTARAFVAALPPEAQPLVRAQLARSWAQSRDARQAALQARRDAFAAAAAEPYDAESVRAAFARLRVADQAAIGIFHDNVAAAFAEMTPLQRREALDALRRTAPARRQPGVGPEEGAAAVDPPGETRGERFRNRRRERRERRDGIP